MGVANISGNILTDSGASLSSYLPLTGGTLTGALSGTSATFSSSVTATSEFISITGFNAKGNGSDTAAVSPYYLLSNTAGNRQWISQLGASNEYRLHYYNGTSWSNPFTIASTGAATFSSSVGATQFTSQGGRGTDYGYKLPDWQIYNTTSGNRLAITNYSTDVLTITSGGNVLIGTTTDIGQRLRIYQPTNGNWNIKLSQPNSSSINYQEFLTTTDGDATVTARGAITYNGTNVLYGGTSDYRLKEDLKDYNALNIINQLKTYDFKWKEAGTRDYGMMAHELQEVLPNYVTGEKDAENEDGSIKPQGVDYSKIVPVLVKAIQEQQEIINNLSAKVTALENK